MYMWQERGYEHTLLNCIYELLSLDVSLWLSNKLITNSQLRLRILDTENVFLCLSTYIGKIECVGRKEKCQRDSLACGRMVVSLRGLHSHFSSGASLRTRAWLLQER